MRNPNGKWYTVRICWNSNNWVFPSGEAQHLEKGSYVAKTGFGHEEWLFNFAWDIDGFHYGFLQPVNNSFENISGQTINVLLYSINASSDRLYIGEIRNCEVLQVKQASDVLKAYRRRGWLKSMSQQIAAIGGDTDNFHESRVQDLFNVRFRQEYARIYDPPLIAHRSDVVWKRQRYTLALANNEVQEQWRTRKGTTIPPLIRSITRKGLPSVTYDPIHKRLQANLLTLLQQQYGKDKVVIESAHVDITIACSDRTVLIEIKTNPNPRVAIREALSQLLEYAYYRPQMGSGSIELVIIAPGKLDDSTNAYIQLLRTEFHIPVSYACHSEGKSLPPLFVVPMPKT